MVTALLSLLSILGRRCTQLSPPPLLGSFSQWVPKLGPSTPPPPPPPRGWPLLSGVSPVLGLVSGEQAAYTRLVLGTWPGNRQLVSTRADWTGCETSVSMGREQAYNQQWGLVSSIVNIAHCKNLIVKP